MRAPIGTLNLQKSAKLTKACELVVSDTDTVVVYCAMNFRIGKRLGRFSQEEETCLQLLPEEWVR